MTFQLPASSKSKLTVVFDLRIIVMALTLVVIAMLFIWKPWSSPVVGDRTVEVTGEATVTAKPDTFAFYPSYEFKNPDTTAALADVAKKSDELTAKLKALGVKESSIKTSSSEDNFLIYKGPGTAEPTYTLRLTITVDSLSMAQKVQNYLVTTAPLGSVSPQATFSEAKRKQLESQARDEATKDARAKVDQMAKNVGFKVGAVKHISEPEGFSAIPFDTRSSGTALHVEGNSSDGSEPALGVQPGENELPYRITVTYYIR